MKNFWKPIVTLLLTSLLIGAAIQGWLAPGGFTAGWLAAAALLFLGGVALWAAWRAAGKGKQLAWILLLAFALRLGFGAAMTRVLPAAGYATPEQQAGYLSKDAMARDNQAWQLAASGRPLTDAFKSEQFFSDQYGGLLALSALVYRVLSPDAHRAYLIIILAAAFAALGIPFFYAAVQRRWGEMAALAGAWILALYPESVFWGASQMREPFLITLIAVALWGVVMLRERPWLSAAALAASFAGMFLISATTALAVLGVLAVWAWLEYLPGQDRPFWRLLGWAGLAVGAVLLIAVTFTWLRGAANFDIILTEQSSGWVQKVVSQLGKRWLAVVVTLYGLIRPLLPAAVIEGSIPLWKAIFTWRALGWYLLIPLLLYGGTAAWRIPEAKNRRLMLWAAAAVLIWTLVASARGGGDASDNPRYRVIFLVWTALLAGWAWAHAREHQFRWLARWGAVEVIFLGFFTQLYLARYYKITRPIELFTMLGLIAALSLAVFAGGWLADRRSSTAA